MFSPTIKQFKKGEATLFKNKFVLTGTGILFLENYRRCFPIKKKPASNSKVVCATILVEQVIFDLDEFNCVNGCLLTLPCRAGHI
jgi:hypothetical protein